jgi:hypothetical protein
MICSRGACRVNLSLAARQREEILEIASKVWCGGGLRTQERICTTFYSLFNCQFGMSFTLLWSALVSLMSTEFLCGPFFNGSVNMNYI